MKRLVVTVAGTVAGLAALLSFKNQTTPIADSQALPSAALGQSTSAPAPVLAPSTSATTASPTARTLLGSAVTTRYGIVRVKVTVAGHRITEVAFAELTAFDHHSEEINSSAGPELLKQTLDSQSATVHTVSGASYTSDGYRRSLQSALDQAGF